MSDFDFNRNLDLITSPAERRTNLFRQVRDLNTDEADGLWKIVAEVELPYIRIELANHLHEGGEPELSIPTAGRSFFSEIKTGYPEIDLRYFFNKEHFPTLQLGFTGMVKYIQLISVFLPDGGIHTELRYQYKFGDTSAQELNLLASASILTVSEFFN